MIIKPYKMVINSVFKPRVLVIASSHSFASRLVLYTASTTDWCQEWFVVNAEFAAAFRAIEEWLDKNTDESEAKASGG